MAANDAEEAEVERRARLPLPPWPLLLLIEELSVERKAMRKGYSGQLRMVITGTAGSEADLAVVVVFA